MDSINFYSGNNFPQYREALAKMQNMTHLVADIAGLGGRNFILSGCVLNDDKVSDGVIVINGEMMPFKGSVKKDKITIEEKRDDVTALNVVYPETYITRIAKFSDDGEYRWSDFMQVPTNLELYNMIKNVIGVPVGAGIDWDGDMADIPKDYMICDGRLLLIEEYPELYRKIGIRWGGDGIKNFNLPNKGGRFSVGWTGAGDYVKVGDIGGEEYVKLLAKHLPAHDHTDHLGSSFNKLSARAADIDATNTPGSIDSKTTEAEYRVGGMSTLQWDEAIIKSVGSDEPHENRPPFYVEGKIIKVR